MRRSKDLARPYCLTNEAGDFWRGQDGIGGFCPGSPGCICGKDALGEETNNVRPTTWLRQACRVTRSEGGYDDEFPMTAVARGQPLCVSWAANAHNTDPTRNNDGGFGGGVSIRLSGKSEPEMKDFVVLAEKMPYDKSQGAKVLIPARVSPGVYTLQFLWDWAITDTKKLVYSIVPHEQLKL